MRRGKLRRGLVIRAIGPTSVQHGNFAMQRLKTPEPGPAARPGGNWLAGMMIGSAIMTLATQAMLVGASAAIKNVTLKGG
jgi:hypothetical protein